MDYGKEQKFDLDKYNLDTNEWSYSPERDARTLGSKIISSSEAEVHPAPAPDPSLMPPGFSQEPSMPSPAQASPESSTNSPIAPLVQKARSSEKITFQDAKIVETSVNSELNQTGDIASVYEEVRGPMTPLEESA